MGKHTFVLRGRRYYFDGLHWWKACFFRAGEASSPTTQVCSHSDYVLRGEEGWQYLASDAGESLLSHPKRGAILFRERCGQPFQVGDLVCVVAYAPEWGEWGPEQDAIVGTTSHVIAVRKGHAVLGSPYDSIEEDGCPIPFHVLAPSPTAKERSPEVEPRKTIAKDEGSVSPRKATTLLRDPMLWLIAILTLLSIASTLFVLFREMRAT